MHNAGFRRLICPETSKILCVVYLIPDVTFMIYPKSLSGSRKAFWYGVTAYAYRLCRVSDNPIFEYTEVNTLAT